MTGKESPFDKPAFRRYIRPDMVKDVISNFLGLYQGIMDPIYSYYAQGVVRYHGKRINFTDLNTKIENRYNETWIGKAKTFNKELANDWDSDPFTNSFLMIGNNLETITKVKNSTTN